MRTNLNEINVHLLSADSIDKIREAGKRKVKVNFSRSDSFFLVAESFKKFIENHRWTKRSRTRRRIRNPVSFDERTWFSMFVFLRSLTKLNKLPKSPTWKGKRVFGVPLRIYQQSTGHVLPLAISNALQYVRLHAGKCEGLFRKPGVKSKIDRLRAQIEQDSNSNKIRFDEFQPFVVADVIRQYFRELPECLIAPILTRLICDLLKSEIRRKDFLRLFRIEFYFSGIDQEEQILVIRFIFLILPDENREVLESLLRFLLDVSIRSGNSQVISFDLTFRRISSLFQLRKQKMFPL